MYTARYLGAEGFGVISFSLSFIGIFGVFSDLGLSMLALREIARDKTLVEKYLNNIISIKLILNFLFIGLIVLAIHNNNFPKMTIKIIYLAALSNILSSFSGLFYSVFQAFERMEFQSIGMILNSILMLMGSLLAIFVGLDVVGFVYVYIIVNSIILGYNISICLRKFANPIPKFDFNFWWPAIEKSLPFGLTSMFVTIYYYIDNIMLSLMIPNANEVIGWYNAAYKLVLMLLFMRTILHSSTFPLMAKLFIISKDSLRLACERLFKYSFIIAFPIAVGTTILSQKFITLIYGSEYGPSVIALQILIWSDVIIFANFTPRLFEAINKQFEFTKIAMLGAIINIILNIILIQKFSYIGAATATCLTEFIILVISYKIFFKTEYAFSYKFIFRIIAKVTFAGTLMGCFTYVYINLNLIILIILSALVYLTILYFINIFDKMDINLIYNLIGKI
jgi:O-antigen/teichoic acid export membrane protein